MYCCGVLSVCSSHIRDPGGNIHFRAHNGRSVDFADYLTRSKLLISLVRPAGFEPATYGFVVRHSIQLSYGRIHFFSLPNIKQPNISRNVMNLFKKSPESMKEYR